MVRGAVEPFGRFVPLLAEEMVTKEGAPESSAALQLRASPPLLPMVTDCELTPVVTLKVREVGAAVRTGGVGGGNVPVVRYCLIIEPSPASGLSEPQTKGGVVYNTVGV